MPFFALLLGLCLLLCGCEGLAEAFAQREPDPKGAVAHYLSLLEQRDFGAAYALLTPGARRRVELSAFVDKHQSISDALELKGIRSEFLDFSSKETIYKLRAVLRYESAVLGEFAQNVSFTLEYDRAARSFLLDWQPSNLFENLETGDTVRLSTIQPRRGEILGSDKTLYAVNRYAISVNLRPALMEGGGKGAETLKKLAELLELTQSFVEEAITARAGKQDDAFSLRGYAPGSLSDAIRAELLAIPGVTIDESSTLPIRYYPQGQLLSHVLGYVSPVAKEEMDAAPGFYAGDSLIGRSGLEAAYEKSLRGTAGKSLDIYDQNGAKRACVFTLPARDGLDLEISIDADLQRRAEAMLSAADYPGVIVSLDPMSGDLLALASNPSFDPNLFAYAPDEVTKKAQKAYLDDQSGAPLLNRATQGLYAPGSVIKPFIAAMALDAKLVSQNDEFPGTIENRQWTPQSFGRWIWPPITRVSDYTGPVNMTNAIAKSDNIYFAYLALLAKWTRLQSFLESCGFAEAIPFQIPVASARFLNEGADKENLRLLADTGYGQGQWALTPLQMAYAFGAFAGEGSIMRPRLVKALRRLDGVNYEIVQRVESEVWKEEIFSSSALGRISPMLKEVFQTGSARGAAIEGLDLRGKTGTAQVGQSEKKELSWLVAYVNSGDYDRLALVMLELPADSSAAKRNDAIREMLQP
jgi:penicillin-binding protein